MNLQTNEHFIVDPDAASLFRNIQQPSNRHLPARWKNQDLLLIPLEQAVKQALLNFDLLGKPQRLARGDAGRCCASQRRETEGQDGTDR